MPYYCSFGDLQNELRDHYKSTGGRFQFKEAIDVLYLKGLLLDSVPETSAVSYNVGDLSLEDFDKVVDNMIFPVMPTVAITESVTEVDMIPQLLDVFVIRHPRYTRTYLHRHDYVEIDYVAEGSCTLYFEDEVHRLDKGAFCLISPYSYHDIEITDESTVFCIMLRKSSFQSTFFSEMSNDDIISIFFQNMMAGTNSPNYLLFDVDNRDIVRVMCQCAMFECHNPDSYANNCCISFVHLILAHVLRSSGGSPVFYRYQMGSDFSLILNYIHENQRTITLSELAEKFHYSKPHLCTMIKQNTGTSFSALIKHVRMTQAVDYLLKTALPVSEIADIIGYNSADHFSRVFRSTYDMSPTEFRRKNSDEGSFIPFKME